MATEAVRRVNRKLGESGQLDARRLLADPARRNLFDRVVWGRVTDFLLLYVGSFQWPTFNVADSAIVAGSGLLLVDVLRSKRQATHVS